MGRVKEELFNAELEAEAAAWESSPEGLATKEKVARDKAAQEAERARQETVWARQYPTEWREWQRLQPLLCPSIDFGGEMTFDFDNFLMEVRCAPSPAHRVVRKAKDLGWHQGNLRWRKRAKSKTDPAPSRPTAKAKVQVDGEFLTKQEVADRLQVSTRTVARWRSKGWLKEFRRGQVVRFKRADVEAFEASGRSGRR